MSRPGTDDVVGLRVLRFDALERVVHWSTAVLVLILIATGSLMYVGALAGLVGRRATVELVHLFAGLALPLPLALGLLGPWNGGLRRDLARLGRFLDDDWLWFRRRHRWSGRLRTGKFNAGQKLNAVLVGAAIPVMFGTGLLLNWATALPDRYRTGATFVHDWGYVALTALALGHIAKALADPVARSAMVGGWVPRAWVRDERPRWDDELPAEVTPLDASPADGGPADEASGGPSGPVASVVGPDEA